MWQTVENLTVKQLLATVATLQVAIFFALILIGSESYKAVDWSRGAMMGELALSGKLDGIAENFDDGAVKCQSR